MPALSSQALLLEFGLHHWIEVPDQWSFHVGGECQRTVNIQVNYVGCRNGGETLESDCNIKQGRGEEG